jgi:MFS family permease
LSDAGERIFYGWWIVSGSFLILLVTVGIGLYAPPVFLVPLQEHFGWSRAAIAGGGAVAALVSGAIAPFVGVLIDRYGARSVMTTGALVMGGTFVLLGGLRSLWQLYALNVVAALGISCTAWIPNQMLVSNWFERRRGAAMGIALAGIGVGGLLMAPFAGLLIESLGWRVAYVMLGGLILGIVVGTMLLVVRSRPADMGLHPDGDPVDVRTVDVVDTADPQTQTAAPALPGSLRSPAFWVLSGTHLLWTFGSMSIIAHLAAYLTDVGFDASIAAGSLGACIGVSVIGRLAFGLLSDRFGKKWIMSLALLLHAAAVLLLFVVHAPGAVAGFVVLYGLGLGGGAVLVPLLVGECFGLAAFGRILGLVTVSATLGAAVGPVVTGRIFDVTGSYAPAFVLHITSFCGAAALVCLLPGARGAG